MGEPVQRPTRACAVTQTSECSRDAMISARAKLRGGGQILGQLPSETTSSAFGRVWCECDFARTTEGSGGSSNLGSMGQRNRVVYAHIFSRVSNPSASETGSSWLVRTGCKLRQAVFHVADYPTTIDTTQSRIGQHRYYVPTETRKIFRAVKLRSTT